MNCIELALYNEMTRKKKKILEDRYSNPAFAVITSLNSNGSSGPILYNHDLEPVGRVDAGGSNTRQSEFGHQAGVKRATQSYVYRSTVSSGTNMTGHLGHAMVSLGKNNEFLINSVENFSNLRDVGTITNSTRPNMAIFMSDSKFWIGRRRMETSYNSRLGYKEGLSGLDNPSGYGSIGFNEKIGTLAVVTPKLASSGWQFKVTTWENLSPPQDFDSSEDFFSQEGITASLAIHSSFFILSDDDTVAYEEGQKRTVVTVCDNGDIVCSKMLSHHGFTTFVVTKESTGELTVPTSSLFFHQWTTCYGCEKGPLYGIRHVVSLDGKYVVAYAAAYYYGAAIRLSVVRVSDGKVLSEYYQQSRYGYQVIPINESDFLITKSYNANSGGGLRYHKPDTASLFESEPTGGVFEFGSEMTGRLDSGYYSTNYPYAIPVMSEENEIFKAGETS